MVGDNYARPASPANSICSQAETISADGQNGKRVLEEEEYLGRMKYIINRDFFPHMRFSDEQATPSTNRWTDNRSEIYTPGTDRSQASTATRQEACLMGLNEYLDKYTSEDNAYFEKLQQKELRRHKAKFPWLYRGESKKHNQQIEQQLKLPSISDQATASGGHEIRKMIDWPHTPNNSLFYPPKSQTMEPTARRTHSTVNYNSSIIAHEGIFKEPASLDQRPKVRSFSRFTDKIGIDGKLLNGSETPIINGYAFIPPPETPKPSASNDEATGKLGGGGRSFFIPEESPRDELAHRVYEQRVSRSIRTPKLHQQGNSTPQKFGTPLSSRGNCKDFSFSPERVKNHRSRNSKR